MGQIQNRSRAQGSTDVVTRVVQASTSPLSRWIDDLGVAWNGTMTNLLQGAKVSNELARLKQLEASYGLYEQTVRHLRNEISSLRTLHGMPNFGKTRIGARITGYFPNENRVTLSVGAQDGVVPGLPVVCPHGLLGLVQTVDRSSSQMILVISPAIKYGAKVDNPAPVPGLIKGQTPTRLVLDVLVNGVVKVGDSVVTSGYGPKIPEGIPIGTVVEVVPDPSYGIKRVYIAPSAQIGANLEVWVLK